MNEVETGSHIGAPYEEEEPQNIDEEVANSFIFTFAGKEALGSDSVDTLKRIPQIEIDQFLNEIKESSPEDFKRFVQFYDKKKRNADTPDDMSYLRTLARGFAEWKNNN